jgi:hypothetical protein
MVGIRLPVSFAVFDPPSHGIGAKRKRGHSGKSAALRGDKLCGQKALLVAVLDVRLRLGSRLPPAFRRSGALIWLRYMGVKRAETLSSLISLLIFRVAPSSRSERHQPF